MDNYYSQKLSASTLQKCYEVASSRVGFDLSSFVPNDFGTTENEPSEPIYRRVGDNPPYQANLFS